MEETPSERDSDEPSLASSARTPTGTPVGVDDPYGHVDRCDHCTDDGRCRFAFERFEADPAFARERRDDDYACPVAREVDSDDGTDGDAVDWEDWADCPNFASTTDGKECRRCGLEERRMAHSDERALIEEHHLSYGSSSGSGDDATTSTASGAPDVDVGTAFGSGPEVVWNGAASDERGDGGETEHDADGTENDAGGTESDADDPEHEITVALCRWCHAKVHKSWARIDDDVSPDPEAIAAREERRGREFEEAGFQSAADRFDRE